MARARTTTWSRATYIGTDASGRLALGNTFSGITIFGGNSNLVGGTATAARNVISANKLSGIYITTNSVGNLVQGNFIGVDVTGTNALGNGINGISIDSASSNTVGGTTTGARNIISGQYELWASRSSARRPPRNWIQGNYIGTDVYGAVRFGQPALRDPHPIAGKHHRRRSPAALAT